MRQLGLNRWPTRKDRPKFYIHDLGELARLAGPQERLKQAVSTDEPSGREYMIVKDFAINRRYPDGKAYPVRLGRDMVEGAGELLEWLTSRSTLTK